MNKIYFATISSNQGKKTLNIRFDLDRALVDSDEKFEMLWCKMWDTSLDLQYKKEQLRVDDLLKLLIPLYVSSSASKTLGEVQNLLLVNEPMLFTIERSTGRGNIKVDLRESVKISGDARVPPKNWTDICKGMYVTVEEDDSMNENPAIAMHHYINGCSGRYPYGKEETNMNTNNNTIEMTDSAKQKYHILSCNTALYDLGIRKIIFNDNATIVFWENNKKTVVKCCEMDTYSREAAIAIAIMKHKVGEDHYHYVMDTLLGKKGDHFTYNTVSRATRSIDIIDMNKEEK